MVKFLSGLSYDGERVPLCTYWRNDLTTDVTKDFAKLVGTGQTFEQAGKGKDAAIGEFDGQCIANAYFNRADITCFNDGRCNEEGKCLPCSKYKAGGMKLGITHSPPLEILKEFNKGITDELLKSPNLVKITGTVLDAIQQDQLPYHIVLRNIQAEVAKCCRWSEGDGVPSRFFLARIRNGTVTKLITTGTGSQINIAGIVVTHPEFPDEVGTFFPVGSVVIAGFEDQPSFYLEPRTNLIKDGDGVIFPEGATNASVGRAKTLAQATPRLVTDAVNVTSAIATLTQQLVEQQQAFSAKASATQDPIAATAASAQLVVATENNDTAQEASGEATSLGNEANSTAAAVESAENREETEEEAKALAETLEDLADQVEIAAGAGSPSSISSIGFRFVNFLRQRAKELRFSGFGAFSKCSFFFEGNNVAAQWNAPEDGTLPCNGVRTDCDFYTGPDWEFATDERMDMGQPILAEQIQEVRFYSDDWSRFNNPEDEFEERFATPFIWAFKEYVEISGQPDIEDMIIYRPKLLFGRDDEDVEFETIEVERVSIDDFDNFSVGKSTARVEPGSETLSLRQPPEFPTTVFQSEVPDQNRLRITHPKDARDKPFIYRSWTPAKNVITLFGTGTPGAVVFIVNNTALQNRDRYNDFLNSRNIVPNLPDALPGAPGFGNGEAVETNIKLAALFLDLAREKKLNPSAAVLGFDETIISDEGQWSSINEVSLVHGEINEIFVFVLVSPFQMIFDRTKVDYRLLHAYVKQDSFTGVNFSFNDPISSIMGSNERDTVKQGEIRASKSQVLGTETLGFDHGYFAWRFKDRGLRTASLKLAADLQTKNAVKDNISNLLTTESDASDFIRAVAYQVVQYRKEITVEDWHLIDDCGRIMAIIDDTALHRVLPLAAANGSIRPLPDVLLNGGVKGNTVAQWGIESAVLTVEGEDKNLTQFYRNADGLGLPANYVVLQPGVGAEEAFGRPDPDDDTLNLTVTFLQAQSSAGTSPQPSEAVRSEEVVELNFYEDRLRNFFHAINFDSDGNLVAGGERAAGEDDNEDTTDAISDEQQDYVFVFTDSDGRPLGKKHMRFMVLYYNLDAINVELYYGWEQACKSFGIIPDQFLIIGDNAGNQSVEVKGTTDPTEMSLGFRLGKDVVGERTCVKTPSCGDHEFLSLGGQRAEFEVISFPEEFPAGKAVFPSAGDTNKPTDNATFIRPLTTFQIRRGAMWYPYTDCTSPRYNLRTGGPTHTNSTERINNESKSAGLDPSGEGDGGGNAAAFEATGIIRSENVSGGEFGGLRVPADEAYRGPDRVESKILDIHTSIRTCASAYTYGNLVTQGQSGTFRGASRRRGEVDLFWYVDFGWESPPFGNIGRARLLCEVSEKRGDYLGGTTGDSVGFRWMPMYPEREDMGANLGLFSERLEPAHYRLLATSNPLGDLSETIPASEDRIRLEHKDLIKNVATGMIDYPFSPYYPRFQSDEDIGKADPEEEENGEEEEGGGSSNTSPVTTLWAWREQDKPIERGVDGTDILGGLQLISPDYFIDNRRFEVRLRPSESQNHTITFVPPKYDAEGELTENATLQLDQGPEREIVIDFITKETLIPQQDGTVYDATLEIDADVFNCIEDTATDNPDFLGQCACTADITDEQFQNGDGKIPSRFLHLDSLSPAVGDFFALYESTETETPFAIDVPRSTPEDPCCSCVYYIRGIFFRFDLDFLPTITNINPVFDNRIGVKYAWSRPPHGTPDGDGQDDFFNGIESLIDNLVPVAQGAVFLQDFTENANDLSADAVAFFPANTLATESTADGNPIQISPEDEKVKSGLLADEDGFSRGQVENIILDMTFDTYVKIIRVRIGFQVGNDMQAPTVKLGLVEPALRSGPFTSRTSRIIGESLSTATGGDIPTADNLTQSDIQSNLGLFQVFITPSYADVPFFSQFGQEFHLIFEGRLVDKSMGIAFIEITTDAFGDAKLTETIKINERKYYLSDGTPTDQNPEEVLFGADAATAYWRTTNEENEGGGGGSPSATGGNRNRAYAWGAKVQDDQEFDKGDDPKALEDKQAEEYDIARDFMSRPYTYTFQSFVPLDEQDFLDFLGERAPSWATTLTLDVLAADEVIIGGIPAENDQKTNFLYGKIPDRSAWTAPGHGFTWSEIESYLFCCTFCSPVMAMNIEFAHLHDQLKVIDVKRLWDDLSSSSTRLLRSTSGANPDPTFGGALDQGTGGESGDDVLIMDTSFFLDPEGNQIDDQVLTGAGVRVDEDGQVFAVVDNRGR